jgi:hypothetical protein
VDTARHAVAGDRADNSAHVRQAVAVGAMLVHMVIVPRNQADSPLHRLCDRTPSRRCEPRTQWVTLPNANALYGTVHPAGVHDKQPTQNHGISAGSYYDQVCITIRIHDTVYIMLGPAMVRIFNAWG